jgi:hypothetical protein
MAMTGLALHGNQRKKAVQLPGQQTGFPETQLRPNRIQALCNFENLSSRLSGRTPASKAITRCKWRQRFPITL